MPLRATARDPLVPLAIGALMLVSSGSLVFTLLAELQDRAGFSAWGLGAIAFSYFAASLFSQIGLARFADRGFARVLLVVGVLLALAALVWFAFAESLLPLILARSLGGLGFGCWEPASKAIVLAGRENEAGRRLGIMTAASTGGIVVGPVIGAILFEMTASLVVPFVLFAVLLVPVLVIALVVPIGELRGSSGLGSEGERAASTSPRELLRRRSVQRAVIVAIALLMPVGAYEVIWARLLTDLGASTGFIGLSVAVYGLPFLLVAPLGGVLGDRLGVERVSGIGAIVVSGVILLMGLPQNVYLLLGIGVMEAIVNAVAIPNAYASMAKACNDDEQATGQGLIGGVGLASAGLLTLLAGGLYRIGGQMLVFGATAGLVLCFAIAAQLLDRNPRSTRLRSGSVGDGAIDPEGIVDEGQLQP